MSFGVDRFRRGQGVVAGSHAFAPVSVGGSVVDLRLSLHAWTKHYGPAPENSGTSILGRLPRWRKSKICWRQKGQTLCTALNCAKAINAFSETAGL